MHDDKLQLSVLLTGARRHAHARVVHHVHIGKGKTFTRKRSVATHCKSYPTAWPRGESRHTATSTQSQIEVYPYRIRGEGKATL